MFRTIAEIVTALGSHYPATRLLLQLIDLLVEAHAEGRDLIRPDYDFDAGSATTLLPGDLRIEALIELLTRRSLTDFIEICREFQVDPFVAHDLIRRADQNRVTVDKNVGRKLHRNCDWEFGFSAYDRAFELLSADDSSIALEAIRVYRGQSVIEFTRWKGATYELEADARGSSLVSGWNEDGIFDPETMVPPMYDDRVTELRPRAFALGVQRNEPHPLIFSRSPEYYTVRQPRPPPPSPPTPPPRPVERSWRRRGRVRHRLRNVPTDRY